eukprot:365390-Chlamydomonas_euryale.AAC.17
MPHSVVVAPDGHEVPCENTREDVFKASHVPMALWQLSQSTAARCCPNVKLLCMQEIDIICGLEHDNIVYLKEYFEEHNKYDGPNRSWAMKGHRGSYNEAEAREVFKQILEGIKYLHSQNVVHRDLKLENLLLGKAGELTVVKIADFGLAKMTAGNAMQTVCGTPQYVAPEVIMGLKQTQYGHGVDMWGAGVVLFILLAGYPPFYSESEPELFNLIRQGKFTFNDPVWNGITPR